MVTGAVGALVAGALRLRLYNWVVETENINVKPTVKALLIGGVSLASEEAVPVDSCIGYCCE